MRARRMLAAASVLPALLVGSPAQATNVSTHCSTGVPGHKWNFDATVRYTTDGFTERWQDAGFKLTGASTGGSSNVNLRLRTGVLSDNDPTHFSYNSPDSLDSNVQYSVNINTTIPASEYNYVKFHSIFDVSLIPDPSCKAYAG